MNIPDGPLFRALHWLINTPSIGGAVVLLVAVGVFFTVLTVLRWIFLGSLVDEPETYTYPTPALLGHTESKQN